MLGYSVVYQCVFPVEIVSFTFQSNPFPFLVFVIGIFCAISILCAASRATWAFARDRAIPFYRTFSHVNNSLSSPMPLNAYLLSTAVQLLIGLMYLGSSTALNAFIGVAVICLGVSYAMPVAISVFNGRKDMDKAPFPLGKWGTVINSIAVMWALFAIVLFSMPAVIPVTKASMSAFLFFELGSINFFSVTYWVDRLRICGVRCIWSHKRNLVSYQ
jgi:amino acid transporter